MSVSCPVAAGLQEKVFTHSAEYFATMLSDISKAKTSIELETFIFDRDPLGNRVTEALAAAARRGVKVRVLVDGAGTPFWHTYARILENAGAHTRVFHPFPWQLWSWGRSKVKAPLLIKWIYLLLKINARNHRKVCLIDDRIAYIGSVNISKCHLSRADGGDDWRDTSVRIHGSDFSELKQAFEIAWSHTPIKERLRATFRSIGREPIIRLNHTWIRRRILYKNLLRKFSNSKKRIWITNAYFVPDNLLLKRLKDAAMKGVDVRIVLPHNSDVPMMPWASSTFYYSLLKAGVRIFEYLPSMLHAKSLIIDDWALVGSSNLNHRSLLHDLEVDITLHNPESKKTLETLFWDDIAQSREISLSDWHYARPLRQRLLGYLVLYIKYII